MSHASIEIFFSIAFLLLTYFMSAIALTHGFIPGAIKKIRERNGKITERVNFTRIFGLSFIIALLVTYIMFNVFIYPYYQL